MHIPLLVHVVGERSQAHIVGGMKTAIQEDEHDRVAS